MSRQKNYLNKIMSCGFSDTKIGLAFCGESFRLEAAMSICVAPKVNASESRGRRPRVGLVPAFRRDERGATAVVFAIAFSVIMMVVSVTIDYGLGYTERLRQQATIDAATLAASHKLGLHDEQDSGRKVGEAFYVANTRPESQGTAVVTLDGEAGTVDGIASSSIATWFLNAVKGVANG
jgi:hypothetical protein